MIGWWIVIADQTPEERDTGIGRREAVLANWETGVGGNSWVQRLVDEGKAVQLLSGAILTVTRQKPMMSYRSLRTVRQHATILSSLATAM